MGELDFLKDEMYFLVTYGLFFCSLRENNLRKALVSFIGGY